MSVEAQQRLEYAKYGCVKLAGLLSPEVLEEARKCYEEVLLRPKHKLPASTYADGSHYNPASGFQASNALFAPLLQPGGPIVQAVKALLGSEQHQNVFLAVNT